MSKPGRRFASSAGTIGRVLRRARADLSEPSSDAFPALDGLRAVAILLVVLFHCAVFSNFTTEALRGSGLPFSASQRIALNLWTGVDLFFVLSGFLIGRTLLRGLLHDRRVDIASFFVRRAFRIFPVYYLVLTFSLLVLAPRAPGLYSHLWNTSGARLELAKEWRARPPVRDALQRFEAAWGIRNAELLSDRAWTQYAYVSNYVRPTGAPDLMSWAWSLCIEEHFYLLLPPLLWLVLLGRRRLWLELALAAGLLVPFLARAATYLLSPDAGVAELYPLSHARMDELFVGVSLAYLYVGRKEAFEAWVRRAGFRLPLLAAFAWGAVWLWGSAERGGAFPMLLQFPLLAWGAAAFIATGVVGEGWLARALAARPLYPLARVSYGMYLVHPLVLFGLLAGPFRPILMAQQRGSILLGLFVTAVVLSWAIAALLFCAFERPLIDLGRRVSSGLAARGAARRVSPVLSDAGERVLQPD